MRKKRFKTPKFVRKLKSKSPDMLFVGGIVCIVGGTIYACYATFKARDIVDTMTADLEDLKEDKEEYTEQEYGKAAGSIYAHAGLQLMKYYALTIAAEVAGVCMLTKSHGMLKANVATLGLALNDTIKEFKTYRKNVIEDQGEEADKRYRFGIKDMEIEEVGDDGVERRRSVKVADPRNPGYSIHARFFDASSREWSKDPAENMAFLIQTQNVFNDILRTEGYVFLNDVYAALGFDKTEAGQQVGWVQNLGDGYIDFGITDIYSVPEYAAEAKKRFVNGYENVILLDFNVEGYILNKIGW